MADRQTSAIVLTVSDYGESDKLVTFLSADRGKQTGIAKGAKRSKKRFVNKLELFSLLDMLAVSNNRTTLVRIDQAELINPFPSLRTDYNRYAAACLICELILHWTRENDGDSGIFNLVLWAFRNLENGNRAAKTLVLFQIKLFEAVGYKPDLSGCLECGTLSSTAVPYRFSAGQSGLICSRCNIADVQTSFKLSLNTIKLLQKAQEMRLDKVDRLQFSPESTREALSLIRQYERFLLQREIHSWNFLDIA